MNKSQRRILKGVVAVVIAMFLYPPRADDTLDLYYGWLWSGSARVDVPLLLAQWIGVLIVTALLYKLAQDR